MCTRVVYQGTNATISPEGRWTEGVPEQFVDFPRGMDRSGGNNRYCEVEIRQRVASAYDICSTDGMNERGLVANLLAGRILYPKWSGTKPGLTIAAWVQYVLDNYATVSEAVDDLSRRNSKWSRA